MAEGGQVDHNRTLPPYSHPNNKSREWRKERHRMLAYICDTMLEEMTAEEKEQRVRSSINERYFMCPDNELVDVYESLDGEWTDALEYYRPKIVHKRK
jgi:hypothetical protein